MDEGPGSARRLLGVFAHPDDEVFCSGGTMALAAEAGAEVMIVSATPGERAAIADITRQYDPDTVITFGADGGYGHPDHVAVSGLTTAAFRTLVRNHHRGQRLYHAVFPPRRTCMAEELAQWMAGSGHRATDPAALQAIALFAAESVTMRLARDDVKVQWFPPVTAVIEQGEPADALYLILTGTANALQEHPDGQMIHQRWMQPADFFGQHGLVAGQGTAHVVASDSLTCLVLSRTPVRPYAGRDAGTASAAELPAAATPPGTCAVDVSSYLHRKLAALARHRTQYPIVPSMLPRSLLEQMLGTEFFCRTAQSRGNAAVSRRAQVSRRQWSGGCPSPLHLRRAS